MPAMPSNEVRIGPATAGLILAMSLMLSGCMGDDVASRLGTDPSQPETGLTTDNGGALAENPGEGGQIIVDLRARQSVLPNGGAFDQIAAGVIATSSGAAAAELRIARLKAQARATNWLPSIGPSVNLTSLSGLVASILLETAIFDNGRKKAERDFAAADVELAAVSLAEELNTRVYDALLAYVTIQRAGVQAEIDRQALAQLSEFQRIMRVRVEGGLSDLSEQQIIDQQVAQMQATLASDQRTAEVGADELASLYGGPVTGLSGLDALPPDAAAPEPLAILRARGDAAQSVAEAQMMRADLLPGLSAQANVGQDGVDTGLVLGAGQMMGLGTSASLEALASAGDLAARQVAEASEKARRQIDGLQNDMQTLALREAQGAEVLAQTTGNLAMFTEQYKVGRRTLLELVSEHDRHARLSRDQAALRFEIVLKRLEIARTRGVLVDGAQM
jgi:adhesin transport system outer membrane protein